MKFVSIDLETTGLNPERCQIIEMAAVLFDTDSDERKVFETKVVHPDYCWEPTAFEMNRVLWDDILNYKYETDGFEGYMPSVCLWTQFESWLVLNWGDDFIVNPVGVAGKNFSTFDLRFLEKLHNYSHVFHRRVLDPSSMFVRSDDDIPPNTTECMERALGKQPSGNHRALGDAIEVGEMVLEFLRGNRGNQDDEILCQDKERAVAQSECQA